MSMSVSQWFARIGFHPWHGMQLANAKAPLDSKCNALVYESAWQYADRAGRRQIADAIERAAQLCHQYTRLWPTPRFVEVTLPYPQPGDTRWRRTADIGGDGRWLTVQTPDASLLALGPAIDSGPVTAPITYNDADLDGLFETATLTATVPSGTTAEEVVVAFLPADCGALPTPPEITPRAVSVSGTTATITIDTWDLVRPVRYQGVNRGPLDPGDGQAPAPNVCAASVQVWRRRANPSGTTLATAMSVLTWETAPYPAWGNCCTPSAGDSRDPAATAQAIARAVIRDARNGVIAFGEAAYDATTGTWAGVCDWSRCRPPDTVTLRYQAGVPRVGTAMDPAWATVMTRLAAAELARGVCACEGANRELYEWQKDLSQTGATNDLYSAPDDMTNPIGARRGQIYAWRHFSQQQRLIGIYAG